MTPMHKSDVISELKTTILRLQGLKHSGNTVVDTGLDFMKESFPHATFPLGAVHEFLAERKEDAAATSGFVAGLLSALMGNRGTTLWVSASRKLFPPSLKNFGIDPHHFIFLDVQKEKDVLWAMEEALKCGGLTSVVGEIREIDFNASRRLQLAVEQSNVTGFVLRSKCHPLNTTACVSRWKITPLASESIEQLPGIGFPKWKVQLLRMRNGKPGNWSVEWIKGRFVHATLPNGILYQDSTIKKAG